MAKQLIDAIADRLDREGVRFAVIGAAGMSTRGFPRQTLDTDLLTTEASVLSKNFWAGFEPLPSLRRGDEDDPLAGVVRFSDPEIDIVVGRYAWQSEVVTRAQPMVIGGRSLPVATLGDLILLKLDAGGYRDMADVNMMLAGAPPAAIAHVESAIALLDQRAQELWREVK